MELATYLYRSENGWDTPLNSRLDSESTLIIFFGTSDQSLISKGVKDLKSTYPNSVCIGCSSAGEIFDDETFENSLSVAVCRFEKTKLSIATQPVTQSHLSLEAGKLLADKMPKSGLQNIFVLSEGINLNGSALVEGLVQNLPETVTVSGGLAADGDRFQSTWVSHDYQFMENQIVAVGFYGDQFAVGFGSRGGWDVMGIDRLVTKSEQNVLYELDDQPALGLYKKYLGDRAKDLPMSGLLFPLAIQSKNDELDYTVRTILSINEREQSITFAGNIPQGSFVALMHANSDRLIDGAYDAAEKSIENFKVNGDALCLAISCVGRKLVLGQRGEEEFEAVLEVMPEAVKQIGFYSYGEISPLRNGQCDLHNQTMTLTILGEQ